MNNLDNRYMNFVVSGQQLAIPLTMVKEVMPMSEVTTVPNMPQHFVGMINLRGKIVGLFSMQKRLSIPQQKEEQRENPQVIIVVEQQGVSIGMIVDEVSSVIQATPEMLKDVPIKEGDPNSEFITGMLEHEDKMILVIDSNRCLEFEKYKAQKIA